MSHTEERIAQLLSMYSAFLSNSYACAYESGLRGLPCDDSNEVVRAFHDAGRLGIHPPVKAIGVRIGRLPESGFSFNYRENCHERGVSLLWDSESGYESDGTYEQFHAGRKVWCEGYVLIGRRGSDGEPLMVGAVAIKKPRKLPVDCPVRYR